MDSFHHGAPPPLCLNLHLPPVCTMLKVFLQQFMYVRALSHLCLGASSSFHTSLNPKPPLSFSLCPTPPLGRQANKKLLWSWVVSRCCLFSPLTAWKHMQRQTNTHTHTPNTGTTPCAPRGELRERHKYEHTRTVLCGLTHVSLR